MSLVVRANTVLHSTRSAALRARVNATDMRQTIVVLCMGLVVGLMGAGVYPRLDKASEEA
jgi:hypothetical protein